MVDVISSYEWQREREMEALRQEVKALRQFAEHVRAHGDTRLASMAIAVLNATKANGA